VSNYPPGVTSAHIDEWYGDEPDAYSDNYNPPAEDDTDFETDPEEEEE